MKCPKCGNAIQHVRLKKIDALAGPDVGSPTSRYSSAAYLCPRGECGVVLSVGPSPDALLDALRQKGN